MPDGIRWVGLDVHARESTVAVVDQATGDVTTKRVAGRPHELLPMLREIPRPVPMVYERARPVRGWRAALWRRGSRSGCAHRARPSGRPRIGSRPTSATRSAKEISSPHFRSRRLE